MRLDKFLSSQNIATRKQTRDLVKAGKVRVNATVARSGDDKIDTSCDAVYVEGKEISYRQYMYIMLNKPQGVVSATDDTKHTTVLDLVPEPLKRRGLFPAGRLDKDTEGFVLLTDDGDFAHAILSPKHHVPKTYEAVIDGAVTVQHIEAFEKGMVLTDGTACMSAKLQLIRLDDTPLVRIVIYEGKYHQIKRMFEAVGCNVLFLKRTQIGGMLLDPSLKKGECKEIPTVKLHEIYEA